MIEYTVPRDATVIIVDGIRVSREYFSLLNDDLNDGRYFKFKKYRQKKDVQPK
jgi:hypothetical protein